MAGIYRSRWEREGLKEGDRQAGVLKETVLSGLRKKAQ